MVCSRIDSAVLGIAFAAVGLAWPVLELVLARLTRVRRGQGAPRDRGSRLLLWGAAGLGLLGASLLRTWAPGRMPWPEPWLLGIGLSLLLAGLAIRTAAILSLGRFFTTQVVVQPDHQLVRHGLFRHVRHPSYTGLLLAFVGLGIGWGHGPALAALLLPIAAAVAYRIRIEEAALARAFGPRYDDYRKATKRLIPGLY